MNSLVVQRFSVFFSATPNELEQRYAKMTVTQINLSERILKQHKIAIYFLLTIFFFFLTSFIIVAQ